MAPEAGAVRDGHQGQLASPSQRTSWQRLEGRGRRPEPGRMPGRPWSALLGTRPSGTQAGMLRRPGRRHCQVQQPLLLRQ